MKFQLNKDGTVDLNDYILFKSKGKKVYRLNGKRHREDGPAVIYPSGIKLYYLNGIKYKGGSIEVKLIKRQAKCSKNTQVSV